MEDRSYTRVLQLGGLDGDSFALQLAAGRRTRITVQDLDARDNGEWLSLHLMPTTLAPDSPVTGDVPSANAPAGQPASMVLQPDADATAELRLSGVQGHRVAVTVEAIDPDDHGDSAGSATPAAVGLPIAVRLDADGDRDLLAYDLKRGDRVRFDAGREDLTLQLVAPTGESVAWGQGALVHTVWEAGRYALVLASAGGSDPSQPIEAVVDARFDEGAGGNVGVLALDQAVTGRFVAAGDRGLFTLEASAGQEVQLTLHSDRNNALLLFDNAGSWVPPQLGQITDGAGTELRFEMPGDGVVWLELAAYGYGPRDYTLVATPVAADDHAPDIEHATPIAVGQTLRVQGDGRSDADTLRWDAQAGQRYRVHVELPDSVQGWATLMMGQGDSLRQPDSIGWAWPGAPIDGSLTASGEGPAWLQLTGLAEGSAMVTLWAVDPDDHADVRDLATPMALGDAVGGVTDAGFDRDWFRGSGSPGEAVRLTVRPTDDGGPWSVRLQAGGNRDGIFWSWSGEMGAEGAALPTAVLGDEGLLWLMVESTDGHSRGYVVTSESVVPVDSSVDHGLWPSQLTGLPSLVPGALSEPGPA